MHVYYIYIYKIHLDIFVPVLVNGIIPKYTRAGMKELKMGEVGASYAVIKMLTGAQNKQKEKEMWG